MLKQACILFCKRVVRAMALHTMKYAWTPVSNVELFTTDSLLGCWFKSTAGAQP
jgi:hypothetical protein